MVPWLLAALLGHLLQASTAFDVHHGRFRSSGALRSNSTFVASSHHEGAKHVLPAFLQSMADECKCTFHGLCSCVQAMEFMNCIADACDSGKCKCEEHHFVGSCGAMAKTCPSAELACSEEKATCKTSPPVALESLEEMAEDLEVMRERKCKLKSILADGYINAKLRLDELDEKIEARLRALALRGVEEKPNMGCDEECEQEFEEWKTSVVARSGPSAKAVAGAGSGKKLVPDEEGAEKESEEGPPAAAVKAEEAAEKEAGEEKAEEATTEAPEEEKEPSSGEGMLGRKWHCMAMMLPGCTPGWYFRRSLIGDLVFILFSILCAYLYNMIRIKKEHRPQMVGNFLLPALFTGARNQSGFTHGLFSCFQQPLPCIFACCCPCLRWADTMDKANLGGKMKYWGAFFLFLLLIVLDRYTLGISALVLVVVGTIYRQQMRRKYGIPRGSCSIMCGDVLAWMCCLPCALLQEAREETAQRVW